MRTIALCLGVAVLAAAICGPAAAQGGKKGASAAAAATDAPDCPRQGLDIASETLCACPSGAPEGSVWGSGPYTADSNLCTAARHAGAIGTDGGVVRVIPRPGQASYSGSDANGVASRNWGSYNTSFDVVAPDRAVPVRDASALPACGRMPSGVDDYACHCPADPPAGSVWGNGPYTADSDICTAAIHNGYIESDGGDVYVLRIQGLQEYSGGDGYGVTTSGYGSYGSSITFDWNR